VDEGNKFPDVLRPFAYMQVEDATFNYANSYTEFTYN